jgi:saccharopine dehydrogenase-like NADP-dependent oxidoreductase
MYDIPEVRTLFRGTLRNENHCAAWYNWVKLGLFHTEECGDIAGKTYNEFMQYLVGAEGDPRTAVAHKLGIPEGHLAVTNLEWLGMFSDDTVPVTQRSNMDVLGGRLLEKCGYAEGERDMIVMQHEFVVRHEQEERKVFSTLVEYGIPGGDSAMARTVGLPLAIATRMALEGKISGRGVVTPVMSEMYNPILDELESFGIAFDERVE